MNTATPTVHQIGQMSFTGNTIPHTWYQHLRKTTEHSTGKAGVKEIERPYLEAIVILSDIIYWYRPQILRDETTGQVVAINRRFRADKLQRSYQQLADMFGLGKDQARAAVKYLEDAGLITAEFRSLVVRGVKLSNVLYLEPVPEAIAKINTPPISLQTDTPQSTDTHLPSPQTDTNTEIPHEISQKTHTPSGVVPPVSNQESDVDLFFGGDGPRDETTPKAKPVKLEKVDVITDIVNQAGRRENPLWFLEPGTPTGDHDYLEPFKTFCAVIDRDPATIGEHKTLQWERRLEKIAIISTGEDGGESLIVAPDVMAQAIKAVRGDWNFEHKRWSSPFSTGFADLVELTASQIMAGTLAGESKDWSQAI